MAHIIKSSKTLCTDALCRCDWGQKRDCYIMSVRYKDFDSARAWNLYETQHPDEARLVKADVESDNLATKQANRDADKMLRKARKAPRTPRPPRPAAARQAARDRDAAIDAAADQLTPEISAYLATSRPSSYHDDPAHRQAAAAIRDAEENWLTERFRERLR